MAEDKGGDATKNESTDSLEPKIEPKEEPSDLEKQGGDATKNESTDSLEPKIEPKEEPSDLEKQIIKQIEYYFGDINLPRDKFLQDQIKLDDGWIPLDIMLKFKRLAKLSTDTNVIVASLQKSKSGLIEVSKDKKKIRRSPLMPLPEQTEERRRELQNRTLYVKGFPVDSVLDQLMNFFQDYGPVDSIHMRQYNDKTKNSWVFKGSAFVLFHAREGAEAFLKLGEVKYEDTALLKLWQADYIAKKRQEREEHKLKRQQQKEVAAAEPTEQEVKSFPKGTVIYIKGDFGKISREDIKNKIEELEGKVAFISFQMGDAECWVRLQEEDSAKEVLGKMEGEEIQIKDAKLTVRVLEDDEESEFLKKSMADMLKRRQQSKGHAKGKRGGRQGGRGGGRGGFKDRKRKAEAAGDGPPAKVEVKSK